MGAMEGLGRVFNVVPIAAGKAVSLKAAAGVTFICTGNDTFTITVSDTFGGSYATPGNIITKKITNTPSGRAFEYIEQQSGTDFVRFREMSSLFA